jgi:hypothetical protein
LPVVCLQCRKTYLNIPVSREVKPGEIVGGLCPACLEPVDARLFGPSPLIAALDAEAYR